MAFLKDALKYIIPFVLYIGIVPLLGLFIDDPTYAGYIIRTIIVAAALIYYWVDYKIRIKFDIYSVLIGVAIFIIWVAPEWFFLKGLPGWYFLGDPAGFNPYLFPSFKAGMLLIVRLIGAIAIAPIVEEIFVRSFLIRYLVKEKFESVNIGTYTRLSFIVTILFFGLSHIRWIPGIITAIILNLWLYKKKDIGSCILAHAVANLCLAAFVIITGSWQFW